MARTAEREKTEAGSSVESPTGTSIENFAVHTSLMEHDPPKG